MNVWNDLLGNIAVLVISTSLWTFGQERLPKMNLRLRSFIFGSAMALGTFCVMLLPFQFLPGVLLDLRYAFIAVAGFFGGPFAVAVPMAVAAVRRIMLGGTGVWVGIPQIFAAAAAGLVAHYLGRGRIPTTIAIATFSLAVAASGVIGFFVMIPMDRWPTVMPDVVAPFSALLFCSAFITAKAISHELRRQKAMAENRMFRSVIEALPDCLNAKDLEGRFLIANPATALLMGAKDAQALIGRSDFDFYPHEAATEFRQDELDFLRAGRAVTIEQRFKRTDGVSTWLSTLKAPLWDESNAIVGVITHNREITDQKSIEQELARTQRRLADAIASMADGFAMFDQDGLQVFCNAHYQQLFPKTADVRTTGTSMRTIIKAAIERGEEVAVISDFEAVIERSFAALTTPGDRQMLLADGRWINARTRSTEEGGCLIVYSDITKIKEADSHLRSLNQRLEAMARTDGLTGLLNRRAFDLELEACAGKSGQQTFSLLMIDVDHFKSYNDTYGHPAGDECLRIISACIRTTIQSYASSVAARYGGEEIAVIVPRAGAQEAQVIASLLASAVRSLDIPHIGSDKSHVTVSIGVATRSRPSRKTAKELLLEADQCLYAAKAAGRDCVMSAGNVAQPNLSSRSRRP